MLATSLIGLAFIAGFTEPSHALGWKPWEAFAQSKSNTNDNSASNSASNRLADLARSKVLNDASPVFGHYDGSSSNNEPETANWMAAYPDSIPIVHLNIPGTHDSATWNYSRETKEHLESVTALVDREVRDNDFYRCQTRSFADMLQAGIRAFDLRYAQDVTNSTIVFWHGPALQSQTATLEDILFGFYQWLETHPSEALFLSFQYEGQANGPHVQEMLYSAFSSVAAHEYIIQTRGELGTLGDSRGKITLFRRFDLNTLPSVFEDRIPGIHFSPTNWTVNGDAIELIYNSTTGATAYIEDYYAPLTPANTSAELNIRYKVNATVDHLEKAASSSHPDALFWTFVSSTNINYDPPITPRIQALGNGTLTPEGGVNAQILDVMKRMQGQRLGIVMFDFYEEPAELVPTLLGLKPVLI